MRLRNALWPLLALVNVAVSEAASPHNIAPAVAILPFENATAAVDFDELANSLPDLFAACLADHGDRVRVVERRDLMRALDEQDVALEGYASSAQSARIGQIAKADFIVRGSVLGINQAIEIRLLAFAVATSALRSSATVRAAPGSIVGDICQAAPDIVAGIQGAENSTALAIATDPQRQALLVEGLNAYYNADFAGAAGTFLELTIQYADDAAGHYWLGKALHQAGLEELARRQFAHYAKRFPSISAQDSPP